MDLQALTPAIDRLTIDEITSVDSLSEKSSVPNSNPNPNLHLHPLHSTSFKRESRAKNRERRALRKKEKREKKYQELLLSLGHPNDQSDPPTPPSNLPSPTVSTLEWPIQSTSIATQTIWPDPILQPVSTQEPAKASPAQLQRNSLNSSRDFFSKVEASESEDEADEVYDDELMDNGQGGESEVSNFFLGLFSEDGDLRRYYEENWENGQFSCLVCGGIGEKVGKKFKDCSALVQHSIAVSKTKRKVAHRAFATAVCQVLCWDINHFKVSLFPPTEDTDDLGAKEFSAIGLKEDLQKYIVDTARMDNDEMMDC